LNFSKYNAEDLPKKEFIEELQPMLETLEQKFEELRNSVFDDWKLTGEDSRMYDFKIWSKMLETSDQHKIIMTRQRAELDIHAEEYVEVGYDIDYQKAKNTSFQILERLSSHKSKNVHIEICRVVTPKIVVVEPRETIFLKYCKINRQDNTITSIKKSIVLKDHPISEEVTRSNLHISGFHYKTEEDSSKSGKFKSSLNSYSSVDPNSKVGITILKPSIKRYCKDYVKINMEEAHRRA